jgi:hypothetical protein
MKKPILELGNANNGFESIPGYKETDLFVDGFTSQSSQGLASWPKIIGPSMVLSCLPREQRALPQNPLLSGLDESHHMSTAQFGLGLPHILLDWTQV